MENILCAIKIMPELFSFPLVLLTRKSWDSPQRRQLVYTKLKFDPYPELTLEEISEAFALIDADNSGYITADEFINALGHLSLPIGGYHLKSLIELCDDNKDGKVSFDEFLTFARLQDKRIREVFMRLDLDNNKKLSAKELRIALESIGIHVTNSQLMAFISKINVERNDVTKDVLFSDFRSSLMLFPSVNIGYVFETYRPSLAIDLGEDYTVPQDITSGSAYEALTIFISGAIAGAVSRTVTAPADRLKTIFQAGAVSKDTTIVSLMRSIYSTQGFQSFWKGNGTNCLKIAPESGVKFWAYEFGKKYLFCQDADEPQIHERFICGSFAGFVAQSFVYPLEIAKTRLALSAPGEYSSIANCLKHIVKSEGGFRALYRGWGASVAGIIPYAGTDLALYNTIKDYIIQRHKDDCVLDSVNEYQPNSLQILLAGATSSVCGQTVAYPLQVMRTKMQALGASNNFNNDLNSATQTLLNSSKKISSLDVAKHTLQTEGFRGFYRGLHVNFMKSVPAISISYVVYENFKKLLSS